MCEPRYVYADLGKLTFYCEISVEKLYFRTGACLDSNGSVYTTKGGIK
ncbi:hypothetical protein HNR33_002074 [Brassicibacter mesophilus]